MFKFLTFKLLSFKVVEIKNIIATRSFKFKIFFLKVKHEGEQRISESNLFH